MTQREITARTPLLDGRGQIAQPGWARRMNYIYNREQARRNPFNLKEWNFYQFIKGHWAVQLTIGHLSYACNAAVTLLDLDTGEKREEGRLRLLRALDLDRDPEGPSVTEYRDEGFLLRFEVAHLPRGEPAVGRGGGPAGGGERPRQREDGHRHPLRQAPPVLPQL